LQVQPADFICRFPVQPADFICRFPVQPADAGLPVSRQPLLQERQQAGYISLPEAHRIQPQAGEEQAAQDAVVVRHDLPILAHLPVEPAHLPLVGHQNQVFLHPVAAIDPQFVVQVVRDAASCDLYHQLRRAGQVVVPVDPCPARAFDPQTSIRLEHILPVETQRGVVHRAQPWCGSAIDGQPCHDQ
jgi:hypothetical protein